MYPKYLSFRFQDSTNNEPHTAKMKPKTALNSESKASDQFYICVYL